MTKQTRVHKNSIDIPSFDFYRNFKRMYPDIQMTQALHTKIIKTWAKVLIRKIINEMYRLHLVGLGHLYLTKRKIDFATTQSGEQVLLAPTNWAETNKLHKLTGDKSKKVVHLNEDTNGYVYRIYWNKFKAKFVNRRFYKFIPSRYFKQEIKKAVQSSVKPLNAYLR